MVNIFYIMGKSATGKDTIYNKLKDIYDGILTPLIQHTTRPMRINEQNGKEYYFVSNDEYQEMINNNKVITGHTYHTVNGDWSYFITNDFKKDNYIGIGNLFAYEKLKEQKNLQIFPIYITVDDKERLQRAINRESLQINPNYKEICRRYIADENDFSEERLEKLGIKKRFVNDNLDDTIIEIKNYINGRL